MSEPRNLLVRATLLKPLNGDPPKLDALLEYAMSLHHPGAVPGYKVDRALPCPPQAVIPIPIMRRTIGGWVVGRCSDPILGEVRSEGVQYIAKRICVENAGLLEKPGVVATTNSWTKSYRVPHRQRLVDSISWFAVGHRRELLKLLRREIRFIGKKRGVGDGMVGEWTIEDTDRDHSWFAPSEHGNVLMRTLPVGPWLPDNLVGYKRDFGGVCPPYWHPDRFGEIVAPC